MFVTASFLFFLLFLHQLVFLLVFPRSAVIGVSYIPFIPGMSREETAS